MEWSSSTIQIDFMGNGRGLMRNHGVTRFTLDVDHALVLLHEGLREREAQS